MEPSAISAFRANFSTAESDQAHLARCWARQDCGGCLDQDACSWCPFTWSCVPNSYRIPLLAPAYDEHLCPHPAEQWEVRTPPFGCRVSSITSLTAAASIAATLFVVLCLVLNVVALRRLQRKPNRWRRPWDDRWRHAPTPATAPEQDPLLSDPRHASSSYGGR